MCLIALAWKASPDYQLVVVANRDEFHTRATGSAGFWEDAPQLFAGRDLEAGGTWLGLTRKGRFAAVTNYRDAPSDEVPPANSRGVLVRDYLLGEESPEAFAKATHARGEEYAGFNLLVGDRESLWWASNRAESAREVEPGVHTVSNHLLDTPWPKSERVKSGLEDWIRRGGLAMFDLIEMMADKKPAADEDLPDTGIGLDRERDLSPVFIVSPFYGTRSTTILTLKEDGEADFVEMRYDGEGDAVGNSGVTFKLDA